MAYRPHVAKIALNVTKQKTINLLRILYFFVQPDLSFLSINFVDDKVISWCQKVNHT